jgi:hypothetical protein
MDEDQGDEGKKTNASPEHKPKHAVDGDVAPQGSVGRPAASPATPGLGTSAKRLVEDKSVPPAQAPKQAEMKDDREVFFETDDPEVNADAQKTDRMIGKESPDHPDNKDQEQTAEGPQFSQSDYAKAFREARGQERQKQQQQSKGIDLE